LFHCVGLIGDIRRKTRGFDAERLQLFDILLQRSSPARHQRDLETFAAEPAGNTHAQQRPDADDCDCAHGFLRNDVGDMATWPAANMYCAVEQEQLFF
jgi:hypothetical protein